MNRILRALWDRLLPIGDGIEPRRRRDCSPRRSDVRLDGCCWWWCDLEQSWILISRDSLQPDDLWLPYWAVPDPGADP